MPNPVIFAPSDGQVAFDIIPLTVDADIDFTDPEGPTGGFCPRAIYAAGAGNIVLTFTGPPGGSGVAPPAPVARTVPFEAKETRWGYVTYLTDSGTDATGIQAIL